MDNALDYINIKAEERGKRDLSSFDILIAAVMRAIAEKPQLNRFIKGRSYYQRNDLSATFIVKKRLTEEDEERQAIIRFQPDYTLDEYSAALREAVELTRTMDQDNEEKIMKILLAFPSWIVNLVTKIIMKMDERGGMPRFLAESDGMHTSIYIANMGSIGFRDAPFHHLYEWGTGSIFLTFGRLHRERSFTKDGTEKVRYVINAGVTIDERISEGIFFTNAIKLFRKYVENPQLMEERPPLHEIWEKMKEPGKTIRLRH